MHTSILEGYVIRSRGILKVQLSVLEKKTRGSVD